MVPSMPRALERMSEPNYSLPTSTLEYVQSLPRPERPPRERLWLHVLLFVATCFTTLVVGARMEFDFLHNLPPLTDSGGHILFFPVEWALARPSRLLMGIPFSFTLLAILFSHEMGHYLFCRYYRVRATLPFFIPAPTLIGTLGAVIRIKAPIRSRAALFDIGIAGPITGFVVAITALAVGMTLSKPFVPGMAVSDLRLGLPQIFVLMHSFLSRVDPHSAIANVSLSRVYLHPTAVAAWVGMFATALNLLPSGQLDGGHIVYALVPRGHRLISWMTAIALIFLAHGNTTWRVWAGLLIAMNILTFRVEQAPRFPLLPPSRWLLALVAAILLALTFTVSPFQVNWR
jgi:membrane-associated protease RseP (regulator of RpoE activity)